MNSDPFEGLPQGTLYYVLIVAGIVALAFITIFIFYLKNLQDLLKSVRPANRKMAPSSVWLLMVNFLPLFLVIPEFTGKTLPEWAVTTVTVAEYAIMVFALMFTFYMVNKIAESISAELLSRNMPVTGKPTFAIGIFMCTCNTLGLVNSISYLASLSLMAAGAGFVAWIMYWLKTNEYKNLLRSLPADNTFDF